MIECFCADKYLDTFLIKKQAWSLEKRQNRATLNKLPGFAFGGESGIRTHGALPHHQFSRLAP